jgi:hypothetical protein
MEGFKHNPDFSLFENLPRSLKIAHARGILITMIIAPRFEISIGKYQIHPETIDQIPIIIAETLAEIIEGRK